MLAYLAWWMMVCWSQPLRAADSQMFLGALAFVAGCSVECGRNSRDRRAGADHDVDRRADLASPRADRAGRRILAGGLPDLPDGLLRTGSEYCGQDDAGDKWSQGMIYVSNFNRPYALWVPLVLSVPLGLLLMTARRHSCVVLAPDCCRVAQAVQVRRPRWLSSSAAACCRRFLLVRQGGMHGQRGVAGAAVFVCWPR